MKEKRNLVLAIAIVFSLSLSACADVDKALYDFSNSVSSVDRVTGERSLNFYNREDQIKKSNADVENLLAQNYTSKGKKLNAQLDPAGYQRLQTIFKRVHQVSHMRDEKWDVVLIPEESFNAFVTGGSYVIVHQGLINELKSDDELAYVIGHEIAHVSADHVYESQSYSVGAMLAGSKSVQRGSFQSAFTHKNEEEADMIGLLYSTLAGYNPEKAALSWERMGDKYGYHATTYSTHPIAIERAANLRKWASDYKKYYMPGKVNPNHADILRSNSVFGKQETAMGTPGEGAGVGALLGTVLGSLSTREGAKQEEARQSQRIAFIQATQKNLRLVSKDYVDQHTAKVTLRYSGTVALKNTLFKAGLKNHIVVGKVDGVIRPNQLFDVIFKFEDITVMPNDVSGLLLALDYAEQA